MFSRPSSLSISLQVAASVFGALVSMLLLALLARELGKDDFGAYVSTLSLAVVLLVLVEGGWPQRVYRESTLGPAETSGPLAANALGHFLVAGAMLTLLSLPLGTSALAAALLCMVCVAMMNLVSARMRAVGRFGLDATWQVGGRTASSLAILWAVWAGWSSPFALFLAWASGLLAVLALGARRWLRPPSWQGLRLALPLTLPFLAVELLVALLMRGDVAVLSAWGAPQTAVAHFAACTRLNEAALLLFAPVGNVLLRELRISHADPVAFGALWRGWVLGAAALGLGAVAGSWLLGDWLMALLFGSDYAAAGRLLSLTSMMLPFALGNVVLTVSLLARGDERWLATRLIPAATLMVLGMGLGWAGAEARGAAVAVALSHALLWAMALQRLLTSAALEHPERVNTTDAGEVQ